MTATKINHVAIVVEDIQQALAFWRDALGIATKHVEHNEDEAVDIAFLPLGEGEIELIAPFTADSGVAKYLAKKGQGLHHLCLDVQGIDGVVEKLKAAGIEMINDSPKTRPDGKTRYAFVHPKSTGGVLLELYETIG